MAWMFPSGYGEPNAWSACAPQTARCTPYDFSLGLRLAEGGTVIALIIVVPGTHILCATEHGYGKRTRIEDYPRHGRGGQGIIAIQTTARNGLLVGAIAVRDEDEVMLVSNRGMLVRTPARDISIVGHNTQGVRLIDLPEDERLVGRDS
jgi:DNA gyrase subunit A